MYNKDDYCYNCKWFEDRSDGKWTNSGRCGLYGYGLQYTYCGYKKCEICIEKEKEKNNER